MCQAIKDMIQDGVQEGMQKGMQKNLLNNVEQIMRNLSLDLGAACAALGITVEEYNAAKQALEKGV